MSARMLTMPSASIAPTAIAFTCDSFMIILGVVPEETSEWNPETAPQAIVMKR